MLESLVLRQRCIGDWRHQERISARGFGVAGQILSLIGAQCSDSDNKRHLALQTFSCSLRGATPLLA